MSRLSDDWPKKRMASGALYWDSVGRFMILKPTYKADWEIPGGVVEDGESPFDAAAREVKEELGLDMIPGRLLCVDYGSAGKHGAEKLQFVFDGGILSAPQLAAIVLQPSEVVEFRFVTMQEARPLISERKRERLLMCVKARQKRLTYYLNDGRQP